MNNNTNNKLIVAQLTHHVSKNYIKHKSVIFVTFFSYFVLQTYLI